MEGLLKKFSQNFDLDGASSVFFRKSEWERFDPSPMTILPQTAYQQLPPPPTHASISFVYLAYRCLFMLFFLTIFIQNWRCDPYLYFIYLTNLSSLLQFVYSAFYFLVLLCVTLGSCPCLSWPQLDIEAELNQRLIGRRPSDEEDSTTRWKPQLPLVYKIVWILVNITGTIPIGVSAVYWTAIYDGAGPYACENVLNFFLHASNSALALVDGFIVAIPIRITHMVFPFLTGLAYILFTILYEVISGVYKDGDEFVYSILDWRNAPGKATLVASLVLLAACGIHVVFCWGLSKLRVYVVRRFF